MRSQRDPSLVSEISDRRFQTACMLAMSRAPYTKVQWKVNPLKEIDISMWFRSEERI